MKKKSSEKKLTNINEKIFRLYSDEVLTIQSWWLNEKIFRLYSDEVLTIQSWWLQIFAQIRFGKHFLYKKKKIVLCKEKFYV